MKFIVDAQLPKSLSNFLNKKEQDSIHTLDLPFRNKTTDKQIVKIANKEGRIVISKDLDFLESFLKRSKPAKLVLVKTGNIPNKELIRLFEKNLETLIQMISRSNLIEVSTTKIVEHE